MDDSVKETQSLDVAKKQHPVASNIFTSEMVESTNKTNVPMSTNQLADPGSMPQTKKKKKKKTKTKTAVKVEIAEEVNGTDSGLMTTDVADSESPSSVSSSLVEFWKSFLLPFVMGIVSILLSLATSVFKRENSRKKKTR